MVMRSREMMVRMDNAAALGGDEVAEEDATGAQEEGLSDADSDEEGSTADDDLVRRPAGRLIVNSVPQVARARPAPQEEEPLSRIADMLQNRQLLWPNRLPL